MDREGVIFCDEAWVFDETPTHWILRRHGIKIMQEKLPGETRRLYRDRLLMREIELEEKAAAECPQYTHNIIAGEE